MSNASRPPSFWRIWDRYVTEFFHASRIHDQIVAVHMAVADFSLKTGHPDDEDPQPPPARVCRNFTKFYDACDWNGDIPVKLIQTYGISLSRKLVHWWTVRNRTSSQDELRWIPLTVLYVDFQLTFGCVGPLKVGKGWVEHRTRPYLDAERFPHSTRVRWFRSFLQTFVRSSRIRLAIETCKPECEAVQAFVPCISLSWDNMCLTKVEAWLHGHLKVPCLRDNKCLRNLPLGKIDPSMAVSVSPNMGD